MPLLSIESVVSDVRLGLWKINESMEELISMLPLGSLRHCDIDEITSRQRRKEILATRLLLNCMVGDAVGLQHDFNGKPLLDNGMNISISHTKGCAAVIVSSEVNVAVDVEYLSERVGRVANRLLREDEEAETLLAKLLHWCAKETLYKMYSEDHLALADIKVSAICGDNVCGIIKTSNVRYEKSLNVAYRVFDGFVLTYALL